MLLGMRVTAVACAQRSFGEALPGFDPGPELSRL